MTSRDEIIMMMMMTIIIMMMMLRMITLKINIVKHVFILLKITISDVIKRQATANHKRLSINKKLSLKLCQLRLTFLMAYTPTCSRDHPAEDCQQQRWHHRDSGNPEAVHHDYRNPHISCSNPRSRCQAGACVLVIWRSTWMGPAVCVHTSLEYYNSQNI